VPLYTTGLFADASTSSVSFHLALAACAGCRWRRVFELYITSGLRTDCHRVALCLNSANLVVSATCTERQLLMLQVRTPLRC
jgi:hypothetical protein